MKNGVIWKRCECCKCLADLNGPGSAANATQKEITKVLNTIYPISQTAFWEAANCHDMDYHQGPRPGFDRDTERLMADNRFKRNMLAAIVQKFDGKIKYIRPKARWLPDICLEPWKLAHKGWLEYQSGKYYLAVRMFGDAVYPQHHCTAPEREKERQELLERERLQDLHETTEKPQENAQDLQPQS